MSVTLTEVLASLNEIAPLTLAGSWDNVGVLLEPEAEDASVSAGLVTIDLTEEVLAEAVALNAQLIISYHPILFGGAQSLRQDNPHARMVMSAVKHGITVYSPHTALDAVIGGVNDWLVRSLGEVHEITALEPAADHPAPTGMGRRARLVKKLALDECVTRIKSYLALPHLRLARGHDGLIETVAVCPGAGGSLLAGLRDVDLVITGEMRHHDVLALASRGTSVILTDHTNCERGYLPLLLKTLRGPELSAVEWHLSKADSDPLLIV